MKGSVRRERSFDTAESETLGMWGNSMRENRGCESQGLWRVRQAARRDRRIRFTALLHHVTPELLRASYWELNRIAVPGIDGETWTEYRAQMEVRIVDLHERVQRGTYRA